MRIGDTIKVDLHGNVVDVLVIGGVQPVAHEWHKWREVTQWGDVVLDHHFEVYIPAEKIAITLFRNNLVTV